MSRAAEVEIEFAGEPRLFRLPIGRLRALQEACDAGPMALLKRLADGNWRIDDVREPIRQGLIGGGMEVAAVTKILAGYFDDLPVAQFVPLSQAVLVAALYGVEDEPLGEAGAGAERKSRRSRAKKSGSATTTA